MRPIDFVAIHWLAIATIFVAVLVRFVSFKSRQIGYAFGLFALGGIALTGLQPTTPLGAVDIPTTLSIGAAFALLLAIVTLFISQIWSYRVTASIAVCGCLGLGGLYEASLGGVLAEQTRNVWNVRFVRPWWLILLALLPVVIYLARRSLSGLGSARKWAAIGIRCVVVALLVFALAEPRLQQVGDHLTVLYVIDRSYSVPQDVDPNAKASEQTDRRWLGIQKFVDQSVRLRGVNRREDRAGVILFGKRPRLALPPARLRDLPIDDRMAGPIDGQYTDIAAALKLALASFPEGTSKRIVLVSDGNENLGNAEEQAAIAKQNGVQIDALALAPGFQNENEVLVQAVEAPPITATGNRLPVRVLVRNANPNRVVIGLLELLRVGIADDGGEKTEVVPIDAESVQVIDAPAGKAAKVELKPGLNAFRFRDKPAGKDESSFSYRATFSPIQSGIPSDGGRLTDVVVGVPGDRVANNRAVAAVVSRGQRRVLFIDEPLDGVSPHSHLIRTLKSADIRVDPVSISRLPSEKSDFALFLSNFDCIILANVPAESFTADQMESIRSAVHDQGCGFIMVGGPDSYGPGGYQGTPIEAALPVDCEIKSIQAAGRGGLVLIMHASEMADGNKWQKDIARLAINRLNPQDMVGLMQYGFGGNGVNWVIPFQEIGNRKGDLLGKVDGMTPGDMPDFDPFLTSAVDTLITPEYALAVKHTILISDGDPAYGPNGIAAVKLMADNGVTCTTVGVATHSASLSTRMKGIALGTRDGRGQPGSYYEPKNPDELPSIYIKESRRISQSFIYDKPFAPQLRLRGGLAEGFSDPLPTLRGFVRTTIKNSPLVQMRIEGPAINEDLRFPVLATGQYGLGKSVAFTSDARTQPSGGIVGWDKDWVQSDLYKKFWEQTVNWAMRAAEKGRMTIATEHKDGRVRVVVDARDEKDRPVNGLDLKAKVGLPKQLAAGEKVPELSFRRKGPGQYEAEFSAEEAGTYFVRVEGYQAGSGGKAGTLFDASRAGVTVPYSPEYADLESNTNLMKRLAEATGGNFYTDDPKELETLAASGTLFREAPKVARSLLPFWFWLVFAAGLLFLFDVGIRRVAIEWAEVQNTATRTWSKLRQKSAVETGTTQLDKLSKRKMEVDEKIEKQRAERRFDPTASPTATIAPEGADAYTNEGTKPALPAPPLREKEAKKTEDEDFYTRMNKAKKRADFNKDEPTT